MSATKDDPKKLFLFTDGELIARYRAEFQRNLEVLREARAIVAELRDENLRLAEENARMRAELAEVGR